ncbi:MAG TPA: hypothetical protein VMW43_08825 [Bacteroidota bacterium]|nr:hypothetical protein [Bacteroidota bacterium]
MKRWLFLFLILLVQTASGQTSPHGEIRFKCAVCHSSESWKMRSDSAFDHSVTGFALTGQHAAVACRSCHENLVFRAQNSACLSCHTDIHKSELGTNCLRCHTTASWVIPDMRDRHQQTRFPLQGKHLVTNCEACHNRPSPNRFAGTPLECISCHRTEYLATTAPPHTQNGFGTDCAQCHLTTSLTWPGGFNHAMTAFPLTGAHQTVLCSSCHVNNNFTKLPTDCFSCHRGDFNATANPPHVSGGFSHNCLQCHSTTAWQPATFDHNTTRFPLTGAHTTTACSGCHINGNYQLVYTDCYQCHADKFIAQTDPNHVQANFNHTCTPCHTTTVWTGGTFDHSTTKFPLTGKHVAATCVQCHNGNYALVYTVCYQCHAAEYQSATDPNHAAQNFSHDCSTCHGTTSWGDANFDHSTTKFPLTGAHTALLCSSCHGASNYSLVYTDCYMCHADKFTAQTDPNHVQANFSHTCTPCHTTTVWTGGTFDHSTTKFTLTGAHVAVTCVTCHNGNYAIVYTDCYACHAADFAKPADPNHAQAGFSHTCTPCHTTTIWTGGTFDHSTTKFALTGAHVTTTCVACHSGNYALVYTDCYMCHSDKFNAETDPNHVSANFSHTCTPCHTTTVWTGATYSAHDGSYFKVYSGAHRGRWTLCSQCHQDNSNYAAFTCLTCHGQSNTTSEHSGVSGFVYASPNCYSCHRNV